MEDEPRTGLPPAYSRGEIGARLELTRRALKLSRSQITGSIGIPQTNWNAWADRKQLPNIFDMMRLCEEHQLTLDWIYRGKIYGLPHDLAERITAMRSGK